MTYPRDQSKHANPTHARARALITRAQGRGSRVEIPAASGGRRLREALGLKPVPAARIPREAARTVMFRPMFTPQDAVDIEEIAKAWGIPVGTAVWAIVRSRLDVWRRRAEPQLGAAGLAIEAGLGVLIGRDPVSRVKDQARVVEAPASGGFGSGHDDGSEAGSGGSDRRDEG